ncbi:hypothetical protein TUZN_0634 [Thermoproteus uzoniensis 768-20]|uniref:Uncharacterized protein n=2 Tax=Thermoproteus TaxID=2270 RepID=F2L470_THEU7|nr:hypothetical protein TUZN_0634 [Thermoproteus uzoniensis 768-20]
MRGFSALKQIVVVAASLAAIAVIALAVYRATIEVRSAYPPAEIAVAIKSFKPVAVPDYVPVYVVKVHYQFSGGRYVLLPGPSPPACSDCVPPTGWLYAVSFGANASPIYGVYYSAANYTMYVGRAVVVVPYFNNGTLYYLYPMCAGGYRFSEKSVHLDNVPISITIILLDCS